ncbi:unnamed protein product [Allacma fusca]|uniref:Uncharacterized protein n=1 Tax=Allacma fusca TaxID=39272 RepID=A0A8J2LI99_9HEXA|nr:unnamed protein product [Allacma fusca]
MESTSITAIKSSIPSKTNSSPTENRATSSGSKERKSRKSALSNADNYNSIYQEESSSFRTLRVIFNEFTKVRSEEKESGPRLSTRKSLNQDDTEDENKITLHGLETWFKLAEIFSTPVCKITSTDLRTIFARAEKQAINFKDFENLIESLCQFRKVHPSTIILRLQLASTKDLQKQVFQTTAPEGTVDRVVDAFILEADNFSEKYIDLSIDPYEEPICVGGVRGPARRSRGPDAKREEEKDLMSVAKNLMTKGVKTMSENPLMRNFIYFAKNGNYYSDGRSMELTQLIKWMKQAEIIDGTNITSMDIGYLFKRLYSLNWCIFVDDLNQFLFELSLWKNKDSNVFIQKLKTCRPPSSVSVSVISLTLPISMVELLKTTLNDFSEVFEDKRDQYEPSLVDTPFGHTPNSRNRHFKNSIDEDINKARSTFLEDLKKGKGGEAAVLINNSQDAKKSMDKDENNEVFSEEKRSGKDYLVKRWDDAYPIGGMETSHRGRIEVDLEKLLFGIERADDSSSDDEDTAKTKILKTKFILTNANPPQTMNPAIPLEEQFDKFKRFGDFRNEEGITIQNIELWFMLAGLIVNHGATVYTTKDVEENFHEFKVVRENGNMDFESFLKFLEQIGEIKGKHTNAKEIKDRLSRCGAPRIPQNTTIHHDNDKGGNQGPKYSTKHQSTVSKVAFDDVDDPTISPMFKARFYEYARFGEATVPSANTSPGISMLNSDKWFKQAKLHDKGLNLGDVDVLYKQLYPAKQRISMKEFLKLVDALSQTNKRQKMSQNEVLHVLVESGPPTISEIKSTHPSRFQSRTKL